MSLPRMTTQRWMVVVVLVAIPLGFGEWVRALRQLQVQYRRQAADARVREGSSRRAAMNFKETCRQLKFTTPNLDDSERERLIDQAALNAGQFAQHAVRWRNTREVYERLATHPWESPPKPPSRADQHEPFLVFEPLPNRLYVFSIGETARVASAIVILVLGILVLIHKATVLDGVDGLPLPEEADRTPAC